MAVRCLSKTLFGSWNYNQSPSWKGSLISVSYTHPNTYVSVLVLLMAEGASTRHPLLTMISLDQEPEAPSLGGTAGLPS